MAQNPLSQGTKWYRMNARHRHGEQHQGTGVVSSSSSSSSLSTLSMIVSFSSMRMSGSADPTRAFTALRKKAGISGSPV